MRHQPTAVDLRFLVAVMKINNDLERMGDSAVNIAEAVEVLNREPPLKPYIDLPRMAHLVREMVRRSWTPSSSAAPRRPSKSAPATTPSTASTSSSSASS